MLPSYVQVWAEHPHNDCAPPNNTTFPSFGSKAIDAPALPGGLAGGLSADERSVHETGGDAFAAEAAIGPTSPPATRAIAPNNNPATRVPSRLAFMCRTPRDFAAGLAAASTDAPPFNYT